MELEVGITKKDLIGMFIRTDEKGIGKASYGDGGKYDLNIDAIFYKCHNIKYSHNLIDLIEVGDYVNGAKVEEHILDDGKKVLVIRRFTEYGTERWTQLKRINIKEVLTHDQFDSVKYEVKGEIK